MLTLPLCLIVSSGVSFTKPQHVQVRGLSEQHGEDASHPEVCLTCVYALRTLTYQSRLNLHHVSPDVAFNEIQGFNIDDGSVLTSSIHY